MSGHKTGLVKQMTFHNLISTLALLVKHKSKIFTSPGGLRISWYLFMFWKPFCPSQRRTLRHDTRETPAGVHNVLCMAVYIRGVHWHSGILRGHGEGLTDI